MILRLFSFSLLVFLALFKPFAVQAQICGVIPATITTMREPDIGAYNLWDKVYGLFPEQESLESALHDGTDFILLGSRQGGKHADKSLLLAKLDKRGRIVWDKEHTVDGLLSVHSVAKHPKGYVALATVNSADHQAQSTAIWVGFFDKEGAFLNKVIVSDDKDSLVANDILLLKKTDAYAIAGHVVRSDHAFHTVLHVMDPDGNIGPTRFYRSGANNKVERLFHGAFGQIIGVGNHDNFYGRSAGWVVSLVDDMKLSWEKNYPRGMSSVLHGGVDYIDNSLIVTGMTSPTDGGFDAAWVMRLDSGGGDVIWERYYRGDRHYNAVDALATEDDVISVVFNGYDHPEGIGESAQPDKHDFVRLLTMNRRGIFLFSEDYLNAQGAGVSSFLYGNQNERVLVGWTNSPDTVEDRERFGVGGLADAGGDGRPVSRNGWVLSTPNSELYKDPCYTGLRR